MDVRNTGYDQFHLIVSGEAVLSNGPGDVIRLGSGDIVVYPTGAPHRISDHADTPAIPGSEVVRVVLSGAEVFAGDGAATRLICGHFEFDPAACRGQMGDGGAPLGAVCLDRADQRHHLRWVLGLLRAWLGRLLGLDQGEMAVSGYRRLAAERQDWLEPFAAGDFTALAGDSAVMARAMPAAARLFADNCAACHGAAATGGPGFPDLTDAAWLWGGDPGTIAETLRVGINSPHPDSRYA